VDNQRKESRTLENNRKLLRNGGNSVTTEKNDDDLKEETKFAVLPSESDPSGEPVPVLPDTEQATAPDDTVRPPFPESGGHVESPFETCERMMNEISRQILMITENQDRNEQELKNLYNNYSSILRMHDKMAEELDQHRQGLYRQLLDPVLSGLARIYIDYMGNIERLEREELEDTRLTNNFSNMFGDILQLMEENDIEIYASNIGDKYSPKFCKIGKKTQASEQEQHGTVVKSISPGFHIGNRVLVHENVEVYIFNNN
jgi:molecular chaperone GrpE (heat shock protein)